MLLVFLAQVICQVERRAREPTAKSGECSESLEGKHDIIPFVVSNRTRLKTQLLR